MSLVGIDVGSSAIKVAAYRPDGSLLAYERVPLSARHHRPGWWELDPADVWNAVEQGLAAIAASDEVRRDPPIALGIVASGREAFPVAADGRALGPCLMAGDRASRVVPDSDPAGPGAIPVSDLREIDDLAGWVERCGHAPTQADPVLRLVWWSSTRPSVMAMARYFLDWHAFLTLGLAGRAVTDHSLAAGWLAYDRRTGAWSEEVLTALGVSTDLLPEIVDSGTVVACLDAELAERLWWPPAIPVVAGAFDAAGASIAAGATDTLPALVCGSWESLVLPLAQPKITSELALRGHLLTPYPGPLPWAVYALSPHGGVVLDWIHGLLRLDPERQAAGPLAPSSVLMTPSPGRATTADGWDPGSALYQLSLATNADDILQAVHESIAYEFVTGLATLTEISGHLTGIRAVGGGSANPWWMQLKADLSGLPVEVTSVREAGSLGAIVLAGLGVGSYSSVPDAVAAVVEVTSRYEPDHERAALHGERLARYRDLVTTTGVETAWRLPLDGLG